MKISIITVVRNNAATIRDCIESVLSQTYPVEYIIIDGCSTDGTLDIIKKYEANISKFVSESDNGIYDAMNKGLKAATGDIIGILNSDDVYAENTVLESVVSCFSKEKTDSCYGDLNYVDRNDTNRVTRFWKSGCYNKEKFKNGWMPPHPVFFVKKYIYEKYGYLNLDFPFAADYELMLRFLYKHGITAAYIQKVLVKMRTGGTSKPGLYTLRSIIENYKAWKTNELEPNLMTFILKPISKIFQYMI